MNKIHIEKPMPRNVFFAIMPALCGAEQVRDYRMFAPDDELHRRATRKFFAERKRDVSCKTCRRLAGLLEVKEK